MSSDDTTGRYAKHAAKIVELIKSAQAEAASSAPSPRWRHSRYDAIAAHCAAHRGDEFAYVAYTLPAFGVSTLPELTDRQLQQTYAHVTSTGADLGVMAAGLFSIHEALHAS